MNAIVNPKSFERKKLAICNVAEAAPKTPECSGNSHSGPAKGCNGYPYAFDVRLLLQRADGNRDLVPHLARSLSTQWQGHLADLTGAAKRRDGAALQIAANRLHRSFASIGATSARQIAEELEQAGDRNAIGEAESKLAGLRFEVDQLAKSMICR